MVSYQRNLWGHDVSIQIPDDKFPSESERERMDTQILGNPTHAYFETSRGKLHYLYNDPAPASTSTSMPKPKAVIVFAHGIRGQSGRGFQHSDGTLVASSLLIQAVTQAGFAIYSLDLYGHGYSEGIRFFIPESNYEHNRDDLINFTKFVASQCDEDMPLFVAGESYGGNLAIHAGRYFQDHPEEAPKCFKGITLMAPAIIGDLPPKPVVWALRYGLAPIFPTWTPFFMPNPVSPDRIWTDKEAYDHFTDTTYGLQGGGEPFQLGTAVGLLNALEAAREESIPGLTIPFFVLHGTNDVSVPTSGTEYLMKHSDTKEEDREVHMVEGANHDLLSDPTRHENVKLLVQWISSRL